MPARRKPAPRPQPVALPSPTTDPVDGDSTPAWSSSVFPPVPSYAASDRSLSPSPSEDDREPTPWGGNTRHKASHSMDTPGAGLANRFARLLGGGASTQQQQPLSSEEIERQAMEDRDRSRREAERLLALEHEREAGGPPLQHQQFEEGNGGGWYGQGQQKTQVTSSQSPAVERTARLFFDASSSPNTRPPPLSPSRSYNNSTNLPASPLHHLDPNAASTVAALLERVGLLEEYSYRNFRSFAGRVQDIEARLEMLERSDVSAPAAAANPSDEAWKAELGRLGSDVESLRGAMRDGFRSVEGTLDKVQRQAVVESKPLPVAPLNISRGPLSSSAALSHSRKDWASPVSLGPTQPLSISSGNSSSSPSVRRPPHSTSFVPSSLYNTNTGVSRASSTASKAPSLSSATSSSTISDELLTPALLSEETFPTAAFNDTKPLSIQTTASTSSISPAPVTALPLRKRYTEALGARTNTSSAPTTPATTRSSRPQSMFATSTPPLAIRPSATLSTPLSTPLPASPFQSPRVAAISKSTGGGHHTRDGSEGRRSRARSVGAVVPGAGEVKAGNGKRAPAGKLIEFFERAA